MNGSDTLQVKLEGKDLIVCSMRDEEQWGFLSDADAGAEEKKTMKKKKEEEEEEERLCPRVLELAHPLILQ